MEGFNFKMSFDHIKYFSYIFLLSFIFIGYFNQPLADEPLLLKQNEGEFADHVCSVIDVSNLRALKVVADTANGMGGLILPPIFKKLPFELEILFPELDGNFPNHPADPLRQENQEYLR